MKMLALLIAALLWAPNTAGAADTPTTLDGAQVIAADAVGTLAQQGAKVIDMRKKAAFADGHLPGALHGGGAFDEETNSLRTDALLGPDKAAPLVFYGHGIDGWKGYYAARSAVAAGYTTVYWFRGGMSEWESRGLPVEE